MIKLDDLNFSDLLPLITGLARAGLIGELSERMLYRIFTTGSSPGGEGTGADDIIDAAAAHLIITHGRRDILPDVAELIIRRNRRGLYIHDLVWCFFHDVSAEALTAVAGYLLSENERDVRLACKLLHLTRYPETDAEKRAVHNEFIAWLSENRPFLYLSGEHFNYSNEPEAIKCDIEARYLHREISPKNRAPVEPLTEAESRCLAVFRSLSEGERELLSKYSLKLHRSDVYAWSEWIGMNAAEQVMAAQAESEAV